MNKSTILLSSLLALLTCLCTQVILAAPADDFVTTWKTNKPGFSNDTSIKVPMVGGPYDVDWDNDGVFDEFGLSDATTHDFGISGTVTIRIQGVYDSICFVCISNNSDRGKILSLDQWGSNVWTTMKSAFKGANALKVLAIDVPNFSEVTDMSHMFHIALSANPDTSNWNTAKVTDMSYMFYWAKQANPDTSTWDTSAVTDMSSMFEQASSANPDTSGWDTSSVIGMSYMFSYARHANPDTSAWDTSAVTDMGGVFLSSPANPNTGAWDTSAVTDMSLMFAFARQANADTRDWDTSNVTDMSEMFEGAVSADPDTSAWDTSAVTTMSHMFSDTKIANPDTSGWDTSAVISMFGMFRDARIANPDTSSWDTSSVRDMGFMFQAAFMANPDTSAWDTSAVTDMSYMFSEARNANPDTSSWDTSAVVYMNSMFGRNGRANPDTSAWNTASVKTMEWMFSGASMANPDTSGWNTSSVTNMHGMFNKASRANPDASGWVVTNLRDAAEMFTGVTLSSVNYDRLLINWNAQNLRSGVSFDGGNSIYCSAQAITARANMVAAHGWSLSDAGQCRLTNLTHRFTSFDADGKADVLLRSTKTGHWEINFLNNRWVKANSGPTLLFPSPEWQMMGTGDFNASGRGDILLRHRETGIWWIYIMNGRHYTSAQSDMNTNPDWQMVGLNDFDGDGMDDVLLRNQLTGHWQINFMNNRWVKPSSGFPRLFPSLDWEMMGTGDFDGDGRGDILVRHWLTGDWRIFIMNGLEFTSGKTLITQDLDWQIAGIDDFDGDGKDDVLLRNALTGNWEINFLDNRVVKPNSGPTALSADMGWEMMGTGDFNGNSRGDVLLRHKQTGRWWIYLMNGRNFTSGKTLITPDQEWEIPY